MIEKDNIRDLFSRQLENHTSPVRPEVWNGLQAKMAAAGVTSAAGAAKGISALAKWLIGSAAVSVATVTTVALINRTDAPDTPEKQQKERETVQTEPVATTETAPTEENTTIDWRKVEDAKTLPGSGKIKPLEYPAAEWTGLSLPPQKASEPAGTPPEYIQMSSNPPFGSGRSNSTTNPQDEETTPSTVVQAPVVTPAASEATEARISKVPNFFSPNNDGENDTFFIESQNLNDFSVNFYDRNNVSIWKSEDPNFKWDGNSMSGEPVPAGMYSCMILARDSKGKLVREYKVIEIRR